MRRIAATSVLALIATAGGIVGFDGGSSAASTHHRHMFYISQVWRPRHGGRVPPVLYRATPKHPGNRHRLHTPVRNNLIIHAVSISPNGKRIAEVMSFIDGHDLKNQVAVADRDGRHVRPLLTRSVARDPYVPESASWGSDSRTLYVGMWSPGDQPTTPQQVKVMRIAAVAKDPASTLRAVAGGRGLDGPSVSPDGKTLAAIRTTRAANGDVVAKSLVTLDLATGVVSPPLVSNSGPRVDPPAWSPNGRSIAVERWTPCQNADCSTLDLDVVAADGSSNGVPVVAANSAGHQLSDPVWQTNHELWFQRRVEARISDGDPGETAGALFSVQVHGTATATITRRLRIPNHTEASPSFGP